MHLHENAHQEAGSQRRNYCVGIGPQLQREVRSPFADLFDTFRFNVDLPDAYESLILDAIKGWGWWLYFLYTSSVTYLI